jgi:hypothetical protein
VAGNLLGMATLSAGACGVRASELEAQRVALIVAQLRRQRPKPLPDQPLIDHAPQFYAARRRSFTLLIYASLARRNSLTRREQRAGVRRPA